jgi:hypothetical protein
MVKGRREELRICVKYLGIRLNGRRPLKVAGLAEKKMIKKLYNDQINSLVFNLFIYLLLPYVFRAFL